MSALSRIGRRGRAALLIAAGAVVGGGAYAAATVPDSSGVIHACVTLTDPLNNGGQVDPHPHNLRVIDPSAGQTCDPNGTGPTGYSEEPVNWNFPGQTGPRGLPGIVNHNVTIRRPPVESGGGYVAHATLGSGRNTLAFPVLEADFSPTHGTGAGTGSGGGKVKFNSFTITKLQDKASPALALAAVKGTHFSTATIALQRKAGKPQQDYLVVKMTNVIVSSYKPTSHGGGAQQPEESITFNFTKVEFEYKPQS